MQSHITAMHGQMFFSALYCNLVDQIRLSHCSRVWRTGTGNSRYREFLIFLVVPEPVSEKIGTGKKYRYRYRNYLVPEKKYQYRYRLKFWVPSHTATLAMSRTHFNVYLCLNKEHWTGTYEILGSDSMIIILSVPSLMWLSFWPPTNKNRNTLVPVCHGSINHWQSVFIKALQMLRTA